MKNRTAHYVASTHWDREWYDTFQGFRMRLVSLLDEVLETMERNTSYRSFVLDGQVIPILDYLEIRPEKHDTLTRLLAENRLKIGPWFVLPDEWLVSGESLIRNIELGMALSREMGAEPSRAGFACDMFGHVGQLPQIFEQMGISGTLIWRGLQEKEHGGQLFWKAPDGTVLPSYRFGKIGYCSYAIAVRHSRDIDETLDRDAAAERLAAFTREQARRTPRGPILLFDGGDHLEIEPSTPALIATANDALTDDAITIVHSDLDAYLDELADGKNSISRTVVGELRETGRDPVAEDEQWLIPGVLSSRIRLKQMNAQCEDELTLWAEPFSAFACANAADYPVGYLKTAWRHLLENHPHDSICGCSIDQVHKDMEYRFDQSYGISSRLTEQALKNIASASIPGQRPDGSLVLAVFNPTPRVVDEPLDIDIPLPDDWPVFKEFFGFEDLYPFRLKTSDGDEIPYQLTGQRKNRMTYRYVRTKFPAPFEHHVVSVTARLSLPPTGYRMLVVERDDGPVRFSGSMMPAANVMENEFLKVTVARNGTLTVEDKRGNTHFGGLLTFEERADIGDGWYHGTAVNDAVHISPGSPTNVSVIANGREKATIRVAITMNVPKRFNFHDMRRCEDTAPFVITSDITLRMGAKRVEIETRLDNTIADHRLRVMFPTGLNGDTYLSDSAFDAVERPVALAEDNDNRRELDVETRPQISWTAFGDGKTGLAVVSRGLPESAVTNTPDRALALTLLRGFRRAVLTNDNPGGQEYGSHTFRYWIVPFTGQTPVNDLFELGKRVNAPCRTVVFQGWELKNAIESAGSNLRPESPFLGLDGRTVITSVRREGENIAIRLFNPHETTEKTILSFAENIGDARLLRLDGEKDYSTTIVAMENNRLEILVPPKRIATALVALKQ